MPIKGESSFDNAIPVSIENIKYSISNSLPVKVKKLADLHLLLPFIEF